MHDNGLLDTYLRYSTTLTKLFIELNKTSNSFTLFSESLRGAWTDLNTVIEKSLGKLKEVFTLMSFDLGNFYSDVVDQDPIFSSQFVISYDNIITK